MLDREIIDTGDGGAAAIVAGLLLVALLVIGIFFFWSMGSNAASPMIDVSAPKVAVGVTPNGQ